MYVVRKRISLPHARERNHLASAGDRMTKLLHEQEKKYSDTGDVRPYPDVPLSKGQGPKALGVR